MTRERDPETDAAIAAAEARETIIQTERDKAADAETIRATAVEDRDRYRAYLDRVVNHTDEPDGLFALISEIRRALAAE